MARARALVAAVPQRAWFAVACLVLLASVGIGTVIGAGLSAWRGAVGTTAGVTPHIVISPPASALVVVPPPHPASTAAPKPVAPAPVATVQRVAAVTAPVARPVPATTPAPPATTPPQAQPVPSAGTGSGQSPRLVRASSQDHGRHLGWLLGRRGAPAADAAKHADQHGAKHGRALGHRKHLARAKHPHG